MQLRRVTSCRRWKVADYKNTINLPNTGFPMKADLANREPGMLAEWERVRLYDQIRTAAKGRPAFVYAQQGNLLLPLRFARRMAGWNRQDPN